jgi:hypothetical protein
MGEKAEVKTNFFEEWLKAANMSNGTFKFDDKASKDAIECIKKGLVDLTELRITTKASEDGKLVETVINLTCDIQSTVPLAGDALVAYHKEMTDRSVQIMSMYAQIVIQIAELAVPWAAVKIPLPSNTVSSMQDLAKLIADYLKMPKT